MAEPKTNEPNTDAKLSVVELLKARRQSEVRTEMVLPKSGITVSWPQFRSYADWVKAQKIGGSDVAKVQLAFIVTTATFNGERLSMGDYAELMDATDHLALMARIFADDATAAEDAAGND